MAAKTVHPVLSQISLGDYDSRIDEITAQLCTAAEEIGFFAIKDHGISDEEVQRMFTLSESFFRLPDETKATVPWNPQNVGWEKLSQIRPSTAAPDNKESYQLQFGENMDGLWVDDATLPGFRAEALAFMRRVQAVSERLMVCLARGLGFADDYFRTGQSGLEICPGREVVTEHALGDMWTRVGFEPGLVVCNIGDLLMSWSDDRFKSTYHRVKAPCEEGDYYGERFSMAFFNQPCKDAVIQGPKKKYPAVTGAEFTRRAMENSYKALKAKTEKEMAAQNGTAAGAA
ncbi:hypothetical protein MAPG_07267 [Magnaporthiopsis poae ATCC 64411]|uniref:Fe2OG dioxygenase domain-containing protein n=1 Tax=Magnaporthiopsis poae (strain ATCC 64411 / 73-15) TaxID=644358 RepID=A0A0C4E478_MAGP6|nr:hypothetical protein MAPG_07267 [Magnaporthiopsis poae ATCC 64411]